MSLPQVLIDQTEIDKEANHRSVHTVKSNQLDALRRPSAGLDLMNLVQRVFLTKEPCRAVAFAGVEASDTSAVICLETARILAASVNADVLIVDADLEHLGTLDAFSKVKDRGLTTALDSDDSVRLHAAKMQDANLYIMLPGPSSGRPLLTGAMRNFLGRALKEFHFVLIHSPSLVSSSDCVTLAQAADGMVLVLEASKTRKQVAIRTVKELESAGVTILGAVLSDTVEPVPAFIYDRI
jgi:Mrp family chromosome partitioning ATPase